MTDPFIRLDLTRAEADFLIALIGHHILGNALESQSIYNRLVDLYEDRRIDVPEPLVTSPIPPHFYGDRQVICVEKQK